MRQSEERLRQLSKISPVGIFITDLDGKTEYWNDMLCKITSMSAEEGAGEGWADGVHPEDRERVFNEWYESTNARTNFRSEYRFVDREGNVTWTIGQAVPILNSQGDTTGFIGTITDINERKRTEEALRQKTHDLGERVKELNCLYGISSLVEKPDISLGEIFQGVVDLIPPSWQYPEITCSRIIFDDEEYKTSNFKETTWNQSNEIFVTGKQIGTLEVFYLEERPEDYEGPFLKEERRLINEITGRLEMIIQRKQAEETLRESEQFSSSLLTHSPHPIIVINPDSSIKYLNPSLEKLTGFSSSELIGAKAPYPWWTEETVKKTSRDLEEAMAKGAQRLEELFKKKNGERFWVEITSAPVSSKGDFKYYLANWVEITKRKRAEGALREKDAELRVKANNLEEVNTALRVLLKRREEDKEELEE
ncbi:MAG: PAS domain S-box protein, partial [Deltaproteobacteria bacterium]|nr:PAS domain S-box protein [Deltaproteobacteria bacterium]